MWLEVIFESDERFVDFLFRYLEIETVSIHHSHYTFWAIFSFPQEKKLYRDVFSSYPEMLYLVLTILQNELYFSIIIYCCVYSYWYKGPIRGKRCIQINVPTKPSNESWERSHLCWPHDGIYKFRWLTQRPSYEERDSCLEWTEPRDPTWKAKTYYLCANKVQQAIGMHGSDVKTAQNT